MPSAREMQVVDEDAELWMVGIGDDGRRLRERSDPEDGKELKDEANLGPVEPFRQHA